VCDIIVQTNVLYGKITISDTASSVYRCVASKMCERKWLRRLKFDIIYKILNTHINYFAYVLKRKPFYYQLGRSLVTKLARD
jgi:hypothetical protein